MTLLLALQGIDLMIAFLLYSMMGAEFEENPVAKIVLSRLGFSGVVLLKTVTTAFLIGVYQELGRIGRENLIYFVNGLLTAVCTRDIYSFVLYLWFRFVYIG